MRLVLKQESGVKFYALVHTFSTIMSKLFLFVRIIRSLNDDLQCYELHQHY
jgi:hypothetical protein